MSVVAQSLKRPWLAAGLAGLLAIAITGAIVLTNLPGKHVISQGGHPGSIAAPEFDQPAWRINTYPAGVTDKVTKSERATIAKQRDRLQEVVTSVYDALFLQPGTLKTAVNATFAKGAATVMLKTHAGLSRDASDVRIARRVANIGIEADGARLAAAKVKVIARATVGGRDVDIKHMATLWLERDSGKWRVIGFEVDQGPAEKDRAKKKTDHQKHDAKSKGKKRS